MFFRYQTGLCKGVSEENCLKTIAGKFLRSSYTREEYTTLENITNIFKANLHIYRCNNHSLNLNPLMPGGNKKVTQT